MPLNNQPISNGKERIQVVWLIPSMASWCLIHETRGHCHQASLVWKYSSKAQRAKKEVNPHSSIHTFLIMPMNKSPFHSMLEFLPSYISLDKNSEMDVQSRFEFHPRTSQRRDSAVDSASMLEWAPDSGQNVCWLQRERRAVRERERQTFFPFPSMMLAQVYGGGGG